MKITKNGFTWKYYGDTLLVRWPWVKAPRFYSFDQGKDFESMPSYWIGYTELQAKTKKEASRVDGYTFEDVLSFWVRHKYAGKWVVVLTDINPLGKPSSFWNSLTPIQANVFKQDVAVFTCKDKTEATTLCWGIESTFAKATIFEDGSFRDTNEYKEVLE